MKGGRITRTIAVAAAASLVLGAFIAGPADAKKKKKPTGPTCPAATPAEPQAHSSNAADAAKVPVVNIPLTATAEAPVTVELKHGPAAHDPAQGTPIQEDTLYYNFQIVAPAETGAYVRLEWPSQESDFDLYMYDNTGAEVANSGAYNPAPVPGVLDAGGNGGTGFESIPGYPAAACSVYTVESKAFLTPGDTVTLKVWTGEVTDTWNAP
jgi:hypothetical protein